jgi:Mrp family chromosome partitioning ATPase
MSLQQYLTIVGKQWRLIVMCILVVGLAALMASKLITPLYKSSVLIQIAVHSGNNLSDYNNLLASEQLVQTEAVLATSDPVLREVASHYPGLTVEQLAKEVTATPKLNTQLFQIDVLDPSPKRAAALANDIAATLIKQQLQMTQQGTAQSNLLVVQPARPGLNPVQPNVLLNIGAGLLTGLLLGMLLAVLLERLDTRVRTTEALTQLLNWPILATIWQASSNEDVVNPTEYNANVESYRTLRTNIGFAAIDKPLRTLVVTSATPRDGRSVVAANLAIFMAKAGKNTLLIDADLRRPVLHEVFSIPADKMGLSNAILALSKPTMANPSAQYQSATPTTSVASSSASTAPESSLDPFVHAANIPNLCVMPSGPLPPNPTELLDSQAMQRFFTALASYGAEVVIFDTPPLLGLPDASILASKVDGTLVVVDITRDTKADLQQMKTLLVLAGARVLGCVVNKQQRQRHDRVYAYYHNTDGQNGRGKHTNVNVSIVSPVTPAIVKQPETLSQPDVHERNGEGKRNMNNANPPAVSGNVLDGNDYTIKLPRRNREEKGR